MSHSTPTPRTPPEPGFLLPPLRSEPISQRQLRDYACASGDFNRIHLEPEFAREAGHPAPLAHGMLTMALLGRMLTRWAGAGSVRKLQVRFLDVTYVGDVVTCEARVTVADGELVTLEVWATRSDGKKTAAGVAIVGLAGVAAGTTAPPAGAPPQPR